MITSKFTGKKMLSAILLALIISFVLPITAMAMSLQQAKEMGVVGETQSGYLGVVNSAAPAEIKAMAADINSKRKAMYQGIAKRNGASVTSVEKLAGKKAVLKTQAGQYIQSPSGKWIKK